MNFAHISSLIQHALGYGMVAAVGFTALGLVVVSLGTLIPLALHKKTAAT